MIGSKRFGSRSGSPVNVFPFPKSQVNEVTSSEEGKEKLTISGEQPELGSALISSWAFSVRKAKHINPVIRYLFTNRLLVKVRILNLLISRRLACAKEVLTSIFLLSWS